MNNYVKNNWPLFALVAISLIVLIFAAFKGCDNKSTKKEKTDFEKEMSIDAELDAVSEKNEMVQRAAKDNQTSLNQFIRDNGGKIDKKINNSTSNVNEGTNCPTCPENTTKDGRQTMKDAEIEAREYAENEARVDKMNGKSTTSTNTVQKSSTTSSYPGPRIIYRDRPVKQQPRPIINNYYGSEKVTSSNRSESTSTREDRATSYRSYSEEKVVEKKPCTTCDNENTPGDVRVKTKDGIRILTTQEEKDAWFGNYRKSGGTGTGEKKTISGSFRKEVSWKGGLRLITSEREYQQYLRDKADGKDQ